MASANTGVAQGGRRRSLDAELNLVPFIDLLSMCICFLLMTAVWIQVGSVQVKQSHGTEAAASASDRYEMDLRFTSSQAVELRFKKAGKSVSRVVRGASLAELASELDGALTTWPETRLATPDADSSVSAAMVYPVSGVSYGDLVTVMDVLRKHRIVNLGVVPPAGVKHATR